MNESDKLPFLARYGSEKHLDDMFQKVHNFGEIGASEIVQNPFATQKHLEQVKSDHWADDYQLVKHPNLPESHRNRLIQSKITNLGLMNSLLRRPDTTSEHLKKMISHPNAGGEVVQNIVEHPLANAEVLHAGLDHPAAYVRQETMEGKNIDRTHVEKALKDPRPSVRISALYHPLSKEEELVHAAYHDESDNVKIAAITNKRFPTEHLDKIAKTDDSQLVRQHATTTLIRREKK